MDRDIYIKTNNIWSKNSTPYVTVVTPVYNREKTILCAMKTIERQTFKDIEYIVVDDGSIDNSAEIVLDFMKKTTLPMMLIKKKNGGVHTARNIAIKYARGEMYYCNDSDDESLPDAIEKLVNIWKSIPKEHVQEYFEVKARCVDQNGKVVGPEFPENINSWEWKKIKSYYEKIHAENVGFRVMNILKSNPWPEPQGVTFVGEDFLWKKLRSKYKTYLSNEIVQIYHTEGNDHLDFGLTQKRSLQQCRNVYWKASFILNNYELYGEGKNKLKYIVSRNMMWNVLKLKHVEKNKIQIKDRWIKNIEFFINIPMYIMAFVYIKKYKIDN